MSDPKHHTRLAAPRRTVPAVVPRLKPVPYTQADALDRLRPVALSKATKETLVDGVPAGEVPGDRVWYTTEDHPHNKRGFRYRMCRPSPHLPLCMYALTDLAPHASRVLYFDRLPSVLVDAEMTTVTTPHGWRSARANTGIREGSWYFEYKIGGSGHVRVGIGRKEAVIEAPVGYDAYSYGLRDLLGQKVHLSRLAAFMEPFGPGDTIGMLVELPPLATQYALAARETLPELKAKKTKRATRLLPLANNVVRDQIPIRYRSQLYFEQYEYTLLQPMAHLLNPVTVFGETAVVDKLVYEPPVLPDSRVVVYKNGACCGVLVEGLNAFLPPCSSMEQRPDGRLTDDGDVGYFPMMLVFRYGTVELVPGPEFSACDVGLRERLEAGTVRPLSARYTQQVCDLVVWDVVDEVESEYLDYLEQEALQA